MGRPPEALAPGRLAKSGAIFQFLNSVAADRTSPELNGLKSSFLTSTSYAAIRSYGDARSTLSALPRIKTPTFVFQGRRDFAFGLEQGLAAYSELGGPKRLYIGDFGHAPSTFPGPDAGVVFAEASAWFERFLQNKRNGIDTRKPVELAPDPYREGEERLVREPSPDDERQDGNDRLGQDVRLAREGRAVVQAAEEEARGLRRARRDVRASTRSQAKQLTAVSRRSRRAARRRSSARAARCCPRGQGVDGVVSADLRHGAHRARVEAPCDAVVDDDGAEPAEPALPDRSTRRVVADDQVGIGSRCPCSRRRSPDEAARAVLSCSCSRRARPPRVRRTRA